MFFFIVNTGTQTLTLRSFLENEEEEEISLYGAPLLFVYETKGIHYHKTDNLIIFHLYRDPNKFPNLKYHVHACAQLSFILNSLSGNYVGIE